MPPVPAAPEVPAVSFPNWARVVLGLAMGLGGYLVAAEVLNRELSAFLSAGIVALSSAGIVPASSAVVRNLTPAVSAILTLLVTAGAYIVNAPELLGLDPTTQGIITAVLAFAGSLGITPPQARVQAA